MAMCEYSGCCTIGLNVLGKWDRLDCLDWLFHFVPLIVLNGGIEFKYQTSRYVPPDQFKIRKFSGFMLYLPGMHHIHHEGACTCFGKRFHRDIQPPATAQDGYFFGPVFSNALFDKTVAIPEMRIPSFTFGEIPVDQARLICIESHLFQYFLLGS